MLLLRFWQKYAIFYGAQRNYTTEYDKKKTISHIRLNSYWCRVFNLAGITGYKELFTYFRTFCINIHKGRT